MFCRYCGVDLPNDSLFCNKCGKPQQPENSTPATNIGVLVAPSRPGSPMSGGEVSAGNVPMAPGTPSVPGSAGIPPAANAGSSSPLSPRLLQESLHAPDVPGPRETLYAPNTPKPLSKPHPSHEPHRAPAPHPHSELRQEPHHPHHSYELPQHIAAGRPKGVGHISRRALLLGLAGTGTAVVVGGIAVHSLLQRLLNPTLTPTPNSSAGVVGTVQANADATATEPGSTWTVQNSSATSNKLASVAWSGSQFVAVGQAGTILTSPDGSTWTAQNSGTTITLNGVTWSGKQFVAVGGELVEGGLVPILTSSDGSTWTAQNSGTHITLDGVTWSGSKFVAVGGFEGVCMILTSTDGSTWTAQNSPSQRVLFGVTWSGKQLVAVGESGTILTSP